MSKPSNRRFRQKWQPEQKVSRESEAGRAEEKMDRLKTVADRALDGRNQIIWVNVNEPSRS